MSEDVVKSGVKTSLGYMTFSAALGVILGLFMLFYPGGTVALMQAAFMIFQILLSIFIIYYTVSEAVSYLKLGSKLKGVFYILVGLAATLLVWVLDVSFIYYILAFFLVLTGIGDIAGGIQLHYGRYFLILLGVINILVAVVLLKYPIILPLLIAWYVFFWGLSRLMLSFELRRLMKN